MNLGIVQIIIFAWLAVISLVAIYVIPNTTVAHWAYFVGVALVMAVAYVLFMRRYYHLHEEYLKQQGHTESTDKGSPDGEKSIKNQRQNLSTSK